MVCEGDEVEFSDKNMEDGYGNIIPDMGQRINSSKVDQKCHKTPVLFDCVLFPYWQYSMLDTSIYYCLIAL